MLVEVLKILKSQFSGELGFMHQQFGEMSQKKKVLISVFEHMYPEGGEAWGNYNSTQLTPEQMSMKMCLKKLKKMHWKK